MFYYNYLRPEGEIQITGDSLTLKELGIEDAQAYYDALWHDPSRFKYGQEQTLKDYPTVEAVEQSIIDADKDKLRLGVWDEDNLTAYVRLVFKRPKTAEVGYWSGYPGRHYTERAVRLLVPYAFDNLGLKRINAWVHSDNEGSIKALERNGFERLISGSAQLFFEIVNIPEA